MIIEKNMQFNEQPTPERHGSNWQYNSKFRVSARTSGGKPMALQREDSFCNTLGLMREID